MSSYDIIIDIDALLVYSNPLKPQISSEELVSLMNHFSKYVKRLYLVMIQESIYNRRYKGEWEPREEEGYLEYIGTTPAQDHIFNIMYEAMEIRAIKNKIVIRYDPHYKYPGSSRSLVSVLQAIDNGTSKFNARPILKKIIRQIESNMYSLWRGYLKKKGVA